jgi:hypothetical protein
MTSNAKTFSTALRCTDKTLVVQPAAPPVDPPSPASAPVMRGVLAMDCTDENCLPGTKPRVVAPGKELPAIAQFVYDLPVQITQGPAGQPCVIATIGMGSVHIPVVDRSILDHKCSRASCSQQACHGMCQKLFDARVAAGLPEKTKFYVYMITEAPGDLALQGKLIAVPVLLGQPGNPAPTNPVG